MLTPYQKRQKDEELMFDDVDVDEKRMTKTKTKDERRTASIERTEEGKKNIIKTSVR